MKFLDKMLKLVFAKRHVFILCAFLIVLAAMCAWLYLDAVREAENHITVERINEDYSIVSAPINAGQSLRQPFETADPIHGGSFIFTIYNVVCHGTLTLSLEDESGATLAQTSLDTTTLLDNTYRDIAFENAVIPSELSTYTFVLSFAPSTAESKLGIWTSEGEVSGLLPLEINGEKTTQTAGFSIVRNRGGNFITRSFAIFAVFALIAFATIYCILFIFKLKLHLVFLVSSLLLGILYMFVLTPYVAPDEEVHIHTAYSLSNKILGIDTSNGLMMRNSDNFDFDFADTASVFSYQRVSNDLFKTCPDSTLVKTSHRVITTEPVSLHIVSAMGMTLGRLLNFNYTTIIYFGRIFNLIFYSVLVAIAVWFMPNFKRVLACVGLLPMCLQLAMSFNYDCIVLITAFVYTALVLNFSKREKITYSEIIIIAVWGLLLAPMKKLYIFLCLLCLIFPLKNCPKAVQKFMPKILAVGVIGGVLGGILLLPRLGITPSGLSAAANKVLPHINPDSVSYVETDFWTPAYMLTHLSGLIKLLARTIEQNTALYFTQLIGGKAGEPILRDINVWAPAVFGFLVALPLCAVPTESETCLLNKGQKIWCALLCLATLGGLVFVCLTWTPLRHEVLWGLQGRYLLPIVPIALFACQNKLFVLKRNIERELLLVFGLGNFIAVASIFGEIVKHQI